MNETMSNNEPTALVRNWDFLFTVDVCMFIKFETDHNGVSTMYSLIII